MKNLYLIILLITILSCNKTTEKTRTIISGKVDSPQSKTVYLNVINHFDNFNENYTLDSTSISKSGEFKFKFKFKKHNLTSKLVSISTQKFKPYTYQILSSAPQTYFFGNCERFFTNIPTFYISNEKNINVNWTENVNIDSISSPDGTGTLQVKLREFYLNSKKVDKSTLDYFVKSDYKSNWEQMVIEKEFDLKSVDLDNINIENSFDNYLYTEIYLGHLNSFLNWFEQFHLDRVELALNNPQSKSIYLNIFAEYNNHNWNSKSLEYYKFTERYVNHYMNIESKSFKHYYEPTEIKRKLASKILKRENRKRYLKLIDNQIKKALQQRDKI